MGDELPGEGTGFEAMPVVPARALPLEYAQPQDSPAPQGLGGWLVLPILGLFVNPLMLGALVVRIAGIMTGSVWPVLTTPGSSHYDPLWRPLLIFEAIANSALLAMDLVLLVLLFMKRKSFPPLFIAFFLVTFGVELADHFLAQQIPFIAAHSSVDTVTPIVRTFIAGMVWIPYFLISKRVKATFVR